MQVSDFKRHSFSKVSVLFFNERDGEGVVEGVGGGKRGGMV